MNIEIHVYLSRHGIWRARVDSREGRFYVAAEESQNSIIRLMHKVAWEIHEKGWDRGSQEEGKAVEGSQKREGGTSQEEKSAGAASYIESPGCVLERDPSSSGRTE